ncbi:ABC transporter permease [Spirochaeta thermophila]|uniref:ABC transporter permease n=1 Tax=Winmispira thermophila (strain ATCC 49972 / DSM 6192 / RI 19.B1) TaxID=665571 RepID=E0RRR3_WINT6|nr:ABC transporter permease [Spirochaeta thermophila]ADN03167.1 hypothetical protein STHERM_c22450 [Spirochaeta thermophila DSM 6192]
MFLKMAALSLLRHKRRTVLIVAAVAIAVAALQVLGGMLEGMRVRFFASLTEETGHLQITGKGYRESLNPYDLSILVSPDIMPALERKAGVVRVEAMIRFGAVLIGSEGRHVMVEGVGLDPDTGFYPRVREDLEGRFLSRKTGVVISRRMARLLGVGRGDEVFLLSEGPLGEPYYLAFVVEGLFSTDSTSFDERMVFVSREAAQELLGISEVTEIRVVCEDPEDADAVKAGIAPLLDRWGAEAWTWKELQGSLVIFITLFDIVVLFMNLTVLVVGASLVVNAVLMNAFDRIREFGTLRAIGLTRRGLVGIIALEGLFYGIAGTFLGMGIGVPVVLYFASHPISSMEGLSEVLVGGSYTFALTAQNAALNVASGLLLAVLSALYAAGVVARKGVYEALTHV